MQTYFNYRYIFYAVELSLSNEGGPSGFLKVEAFTCYFWSLTMQSCDKVVNG